MREIKFRAWDKKNQQMLYDLENDDGENGGTLGVHCKDENEFVMQFTGLKDKTGRDIYEGDILRGCPSGYIPEKRTLGRPVEVVFVEPGKGYCKEPKCGWYIKEGESFSMIQVWIHVCGCGYEEVIGNIYENPELLAETKPRG